MAVASATELEDSDEFPHFTIEINQDPKLRFQEPAAHFKNEIVETMDAYLEYLPTQIVKFFDTTYGIWYYT